MLSGLPRPLLSESAVSLQAARLVRSGIPVCYITIEVPPSLVSRAAVKHCVLEKAPQLLQVHAPTDCFLQKVGQAAWDAPSGARSGCSCGGFFRMSDSRGERVLPDGSLRIIS